MKNLLLLALLATIYACSHPIEIVGEGDVLSATGTRNCYLEDFQAKKENCTKNLVQGSYKETYYAVARSGWEFDKWINYCADSVINECAFSIPADAVQKNWGTTVPALVAVFNKLPVTPPEPPAFPSVDQDGNVSFATAKVVSDQSVTNDTVSSSSDADYFKFTAGETAYYSVALEFSIPNVSLYWYNDDANATLVGESGVSGATKQIVEGKRLEKGKTYYIGVQAISQQETQNYTLTISRASLVTGAVIVNIRGSSWEVQTILAKADDGFKFLQDQVWYGDFDLAKEFAEAVGFDLGAPNSNPFYQTGPAFAYNFDTYLTPPQRWTNAAAWEADLTGTADATLYRASMSETVTYALAREVPLPAAP